MSSRLETLKTMLEQDPKNALAHYGLAMEHVREGSLAEAVGQFRDLMARNPDYCAAYYHCGQTLEKMGDREAAADMYRQGIETATRVGDVHTRSELEAALAMVA